ncbi:unnamed protein product [Chironomus riparius]|uniref:MD-2-related lipid-recognition domain-containing protein n=1 Tax=Chironomus riparius TaxID=315576 RepID=A0A9N9S4T6_9DIPT|nr:unnamed protein product [Chironomus riparius]
MFLKLLFLTFLRVVLVSSIAQVIKIENCTSVKQKCVLDRCKVHDEYVDFVFLIKEPLISLFFETTLLKLEEGKARQIFKTPKFDWCGGLGKAIRTASPILKVFFSSNFEKFPEAMLKCPIKGTINIFNISTMTSFFDFLPSGIYRMRALVFEKINDPFFIFSFQVKISN